MQILKRASVAKNNQSLFLFLMVLAAPFFTVKKPFVFFNLAPSQHRMHNTLSPEFASAKPFLKWAGGKSQLLSAIEAVLPADLHMRRPLTFVEPFIGSGAVLFWFLQRFPQVQKAVINDANPDLVKAYQTIRDQPQALIELLGSLQEEYYGLQNEPDRRDFFMEKRKQFNARLAGVVENTALLIYLNRTCFNGLYRVNSKGQFNVPFGRYNRPKICDRETLLADSRLLQNVIILEGDFEQTLAHATPGSFFYFDPPYRPLSKTASFNAYAKDMFDDAEQRRLRQFCDRLTAQGHQWLLSNSDPKNTAPDDDFFDALYRGEGLWVKRVRARRAINSNAAKRGEIHELLIGNYAVETIR